MVLLYAPNIQMAEALRGSLTNHSRKSQYRIECKLLYAPNIQVAAALGQFSRQPFSKVPVESIQAVAKEVLDPAFNGDLLYAPNIQVAEALSGSLASHS